MEVHRGEVFYADLSPVVGSEQGGVRPVLIVQNEIGNRHSPTVIAAAITSRLDKARLPTHINIRAADTGLAKDSVVLLEQIRTLDKHRLRERAGQITPEDQKRVDQALDVSLGLLCANCDRFFIFQLNFFEKAREGWLFPPENAILFCRMVVLSCTAYAGFMMISEG